MRDAIPLFLVVTGLLAWLNRRFFRLPSTIGVMASALVLSAVLILLDRVGVELPRAYGQGLMAQANFPDVLMQGLLSILLFAGALHTDLGALRDYRVPVALLAFGGTIVSAALIGLALWAAPGFIAVPLSLAWCLAFGALIAPTDPISVTGILRSIGAPRNLETVISGESLFNDGVGIVLFILVSSVLASGHVPSAAEAAMTLLREAGGGLLFGVALGYLTYRMLRSIDSYQEEVLLTLAAVVGGYALADAIGVSAPLAMVAAGLLVGSKGRAHGMSDQTRIQVDQFWDLLDSICNAVLFVLIGLEALLLALPWPMLVDGLVATAVTLGVRVLVVGVPVALLRRQARLPPGAWQVLSWGGLRGGISVALALSLPLGKERDLIVAMTYVAVVFSVLVQGLSVGWLVRRLVPCSGEDSG